MTLGGSVQWRCRAVVNSGEALDAICDFIIKEGILEA